MALYPYALVDNIQDVFSYLVFDDTQKTQYAIQVEQWINSCSIQLERLCNRPLKARDFDVTQDGNDRVTLMAEYYPINSITTIEISTWDFSNTYTLTPATDVTYDAYSGKITILSPAQISRWLPGNENIHLEYNAGFTSYDLEPLRDACLELIAIRWREMGGNPLELVRSDKIGTNVSFTKFDPRRLPHIVEQVVREYRRTEV